MEAAVPVRYALDIVSLSKRFRRQTLPQSGYTTIKSAALAGLRKIMGATNGNTLSERALFTYAIRDLTLRIPQGSSVGIIGRNGSGKSTLLKLISGIYKPDQGSVHVNGRVAALIELGAGFHPDFTGRENVHLAGVLHGLTRAQIDQLLPQIVEFAELAEVIDDPVRTYSSGMFMRLGFSVAIHTDPDILIVDEVLAVGDAAFVSKCKDRITQLKHQGKTLLLVSHDLDAVERWCDEALWLHQGEVRDRGDPRRVIDHYRTFLERGQEDELRHAQRDDEVRLNAGGERAEAIHENVELPQRWGSREVEIVSIKLKKLDGEDHLLFHPNEGLMVEAEYVVRDPAHIQIKELVFGVCITRNDGVVMHGTNTAIERLADLPSSPHGKVQYRIARLGLLEGAYRLDVAVHREDGYPYDYHQGASKFVVRWGEKQVGVLLPEREWRFL